MARLLLDENLPRALLGHLTPQTGSTVQAMRWSGTRNGALLRRAEGQFDVLVIAFDIGAIVTPDAVHQD